MNSIRNEVFSTCTRFTLGRALASGNDEAKFHSSSSFAALLVGPVADAAARSRREDPAGAGCGGLGLWDGNGLA